MNNIDAYISEAITILQGLNRDAILNAIELLAEVKSSGGRLFILGIGGSAANASHAVNDFRKITGIEAYAPTDNVSELTARTNDDGFESVFSNWLKVSRLNSKDVLLVLSVGGGNKGKGVSVNLIRAMECAKEVGAKSIAIVGRSDGYAAQHAEHAIVISNTHPERLTPHAEEFQGIIWHLMVSHPLLKSAQTKWESLGA